MSREPTKDPIGWMWSACLALLGCAIALSLSVQLLSSIWPWLLGIGIFLGVVGIVLIVLRIRAARRRKW